MIAFPLRKGWTRSRRIRETEAIREWFPEVDKEVGFHG
jgi:hypothetical protein